MSFRFSKYRSLFCLMKAAFVEWLSTRNKGSPNCTTVTVVVDFRKYMSLNARSTLNTRMPCSQGASQTPRSQPTATTVRSRRTHCQTPATTSPATAAGLPLLDRQCTRSQATPRACAERAARANEASARETSLCKSQWVGVNLGTKHVTPFVSHPNAFLITLRSMQNTEAYHHADNG